MNYQSNARELTLISKKYLQFFKDDNDGTVENILAERFNNENKKILLGHSFPTRRQSVTLGKVFELPEEYLMK